MTTSSDYNNRIQAIIDLMAITPDDIEHRKAYLELGAADLQALAALQSRLLPIHQQLLDAFYAHLQSFPQIADKLQDEDTRQRLHQQQQRYFTELLSGQYDWNYVENRLRIGVAHEQVGLQPRWYIGSYCKYLTLLFAEIIHASPQEGSSLLPVLQAVLKVAFFDIGLVLETYSAADRESILALKEYAERVVSSVPSGLMVVNDALMIQGANGFFDTFFPAGHKQLKGRVIAEVFHDQADLISRIREVLQQGSNQSGIEFTWSDIDNRLHRMNLTLVPIKPGSAQLTTREALVLLIVEDVTEKQQLVNATQMADNRIRAIMENVAEGIVTIDSSGRIETFNKAAEALFEYRANEVIGKNVGCLMPEPFLSHHDNYLETFLQSGVRRCLNRGFREVQGVTRSGKVFDMELSISEIPMKNERIFIGIMRDISERVKAESTMTKLSMALEQSADAVMITDANGKIEYVNKGFISTTGYVADEVVGKTPSVLKSGMQGTEFYRTLWKSIQTGNVYRDILVNRKKNGDLYYEEKTITPLLNTQGVVTHFISTGRDITERMRTQERLQFLAQHDILTALPNRLLFMDRVKQAIVGAERHRRMVAVMFMDLDRFKKINDTLGHQVGDSMLVMLANRLIATLREGDTIARLSGDEFAVLLQDVSSVNDVPPIINKILDQFKKPFELNQHQLFVTTSIGIAMFPQDGRDAEQLIKNADTAMYAAKARGRGTFGFYSPEMNVRAEEQLFLENELRQALTKNQFHLVYQPQICLLNHSVMGVEALLRWQHPTRGTIEPEIFVGMLEDMGLINQVGDWVLQHACRQLMDWQQSGIDIPRMAVNISPHQLGVQEFSRTVKQIIREYKLRPAQLELEITEHTLVDNTRGAIEQLHDLHQSGIRIAMDDFGTGYCSLSYLQQLPLNSLKIDRTFIRKIPENSESSKLINAIIAMGRSLNLSIIAEGVETAYQYEFLRNTVCEGIQGYYISHPISAEAVQQFVTNR